MQMKIFGPRSGHQVPTILLLHGGGLSWWNYAAVAKLLEPQNKVILPILDGHSGSDFPFTTIENAAGHLIETIDEVCGGHLSLLGGVSLGAQVALAAMAQRADLCDTALIESALIRPMVFTHHLIRPACTVSYPLIQKRWFAQLQFRALHLPSELFDAYYQDSCRISKSSLAALLAANTGFSPAPELKSCHADTLVAVGSRESPIMRRSAAELCRLMPNARLRVLQGYRHGEFSLSHPDLYAAAVRQLL